MLAGVCAIALWRRRPADALGALVIVAGANLTTQAMKAVLAHPRLQAAVGVGPHHEVGFPSGHATAAASIAIALVLVVAAAAATRRGDSRRRPLRRRRRPR